MAALDDRLPHAPGLAGAGVPPCWTLQLLGGMQASDGTQTLSRWPSRAVAALLARLALAPERAHSREELVELLWPGVSIEVGRNRLRQALSSLKSLIEPVADRSRLIIAADRLLLRVTPGAVACDVRAFEHHVLAGHFDAARALYRGELMPGFYDEWVIEERRRLATLFERGFSGPPPAPAPAPRRPGLRHGRWRRCWPLHPARSHTP
jgi:DNA-binding SARP family transcriptional activator